MLPSHVLRAMARVLAFDLHSPPQAPVYLRIGLIGLSPIGLNTQIQNPNESHILAHFDVGLHLQSGLPGIVLKQPRIILQLLIMRSHAGYQVILILNLFIFWYLFDPKILFNLFVVDDKDLFFFS